MKQIKLSQDGFGKYANGKEVVNVCQDLEFEVDYKFDNNAEVYFVADNGKTKRKGVIKSNKFKLPCSFLKLGDLALKIEVISNDNIKEFTVEKLIVMEENDEIKTIPEIERMKEIIRHYSNIVEDLKRKNEILTKLVGGLYETEIKVGEEDE